MSNVTTVERKEDVERASFIVLSAYHREPHNSEMLKQIEELISKHPALASSINGVYDINNELEDIKIFMKSKGLEKEINDALKELLRTA
ncbi:MAG: hypothetical protein QW091_01025 [Candidatus Micrarchaeaceae archaeon]